MDAEQVAAPTSAVSRTIAADGRHMRSDAAAYGEVIVALRALDWAMLTPKPIADVVKLCTLQPSWPLKC